MHNPVWFACHSVARRAARWARAFCCLLLLCVANAAPGATEVVYPSPESVGDHRWDYYWQLLRIALDKTVDAYGPYTMRSSTRGTNISRSVLELEAGNLSVIVWATNNELEQRLLPIRIPLDKGLVGYRVFLIRRELQPRLDAVKSLAELTAYSTGMGVGWVGTRAMEQAGFKVVRGSDYEGLFGMLVEKRFDLFSRSLTEAIDEYDQRKAAHPELAIERSLLLYYPLPRYFFVAPSASGRELGTRIELGLNRMLKDGTFDKMFNAYKKPVEQRLDLRTRKLFRIENPDLPPGAPLQRKELWYDPSAPSH